MAYLRVRGRAHQRLFMTVNAPSRPLEPTGVRSLVRHAYQRAGLEPVGAHQLRHSLASDLLRAGASLVAIGQVLRHQDLQSTAIYAKVDLERLIGRAAMAGSDTMTSFADHVTEYLRLRRSFGFKLEEHERLLRKFATHLDARCRDRDHRARRWGGRLSGGARRKRRSRDAAAGHPRVRALHVRPGSGTEIPPTQLIPTRRRRRTPFIYTSADIAALMEQARTGVRYALVAATHETLIGLLAVTGMRISEAIKLDRGDVDWTDAMLLVREPKFNKSRYLPVHPSTLDALSATPRCATACARIRSGRASSSRCATDGSTTAPCRKRSDVCARTPASARPRRSRRDCMI